MSTLFSKCRSSWEQESHKEAILSYKIHLVLRRLGRAEQRRAEQRRAEQRRAEQRRAEQGRAERTCTSFLTELLSYINHNYYE